MSAVRGPAAPFVTLNCAAVPAELIESELFGHEKGSFTGAAGRHLGKFEQAQHGTIFLDEIGDMPLTMQAKLLRVLEEGEVERIGGERAIPVDVRVVVATHRDLEAQVRDGKFRQDLFHRVFVFPLRLPPLRERREDIPALIEHFALQVSATNGWKPMRFTERRDGCARRAAVAGQCPRTQKRSRAADAAGNFRRSHLRNRGAGAARFTVGYNVRARFRIGRHRPARRPRARLREANHPGGVETQSPPDLEHGAGAGTGAIASL